jgi:Icc-related predicted phosphoesterase
MNNTEQQITTEEVKPQSNKLRFKCFSDIHWKCFGFINTYVKPAEDDPNLDAVFLCGDLGIFYDTATNDAVDAIKAKWPSAKIFYVPGNHDFMNTDDPERLPFSLANVDVWLTGDEIEPYNLKGFNIYGTRYWECAQPNCINRIARNGMCNTEEMRKNVQRIPEGLDILLSHCPAEVLDCTGPSGSRYGSHELQVRLDELASKGQQPKYHIFGHIHGSGGNISASEDTNITSINCAILTEGYAINPSAVQVLSQTFEIEK